MNRRTLLKGVALAKAAFGLHGLGRRGQGRYRRVGRRINQYVSFSKVGEAQRNDYDISIDGNKAKSKDKGKSTSLKPEAERAHEMELADDAPFD